MRNLLRIIVVAFIFMGSKAQGQQILIDSCGLDDVSELNEYELNYFQKALSISYPLEYNELELSGKRILFLSGNYGAIPKTKSSFFNLYGKPWFKENNFPHLQIIALNPEEKRTLVDFDVILISWSKIPVSNRNRSRFIENGRKSTSSARNTKNQG